LGEEFLLDEDAVQQHFSEQSSDLFDNIAAGNFPRFTLYIQTLDPEDDSQWANVTFDVLDPTKEWDVNLFPLRKVGDIVFNENPVSKFTENDMIAFAPGLFVPGILPSDDKLLQARLLAYFDAQRYRLGVNNQLLSINRPKCPYSDFHVDGVMQPNTDGYSATSLNYFPSLTTGLGVSPPLPADQEDLDGKKVRESIEPVDDDYNQAGRRYQQWSADRQERFAERVGTTLSSRGVTPYIQEVWLEHWRQVDSELPGKIEEYMTGSKAKSTEARRRRNAFHRTSGSHQ